MASGEREELWRCSLFGKSVISFPPAVTNAPQEARHTSWRVAVASRLRAAGRKKQHESVPLIILEFRLTLDDKDSSHLLVLNTVKAVNPVNPHVFQICPSEISFKEK